LFPPAEGRFGEAGVGSVRWLSRILAVVPGVPFVGPALQVADTDLAHSSWLD
jgi:hypothetical protein